MRFLPQPGKISKTMKTDEKSMASKLATPQLIVLPKPTPKRQKLTERQKELHAKFQKCGKNAKEWMRKCVLMLPKIEVEVGRNERLKSLINLKYLTHKWAGT